MAHVGSVELYDDNTLIEILEGLGFTTDVCSDGEKFLILRSYGTRLPTIWTNAGAIALRSELEGWTISSCIDKWIKL